MSAIQFDRIFRLSPNPYVLLDRDLVIVTMNDAYLEVTGRTREDIVGRAMFDAFPSDPDSESHQQLRSSLEYVVKSGERDEIATIRYDIPVEGGYEERYWSATHTPLLGSDETTEYVLQHTVDITELHQLRQLADEFHIAGLPTGQVETGLLRRAQAVQDENEALEAETAQLRELFAQAPGFMAVLTGPDHVFELANAAYRQLVGHRDVLGKPVAEALHEVVGQGFVELLDEVFDSGRPFVGRGVAVDLQTAPGETPEQRILDFVYQPISGPDSSVSGVFVQGHDVTEQQRAVQALSETEERFRLVAESAPVMLWMGDPGGKCVYLNRAQREFWGVDAERIGDFNWQVTIHEDDLQALGESFAAGMENHTPFLVDARYRRSDGEYRMLSTDARPRFGAGGEFLGMIGVNIDVTDIRREMQQREKAEEHQRLLINELNHRVKNMLAIVQSLAQQSFKTVEDPERARAIFDARIHALAAAHSLLTQQNWSSASLYETLTLAVRATAGENAGRVKIGGPDVMLAPQTAVSLAMAVHELCTNAIKYGALSNDSGSIDFTWTIDHSPADHDLLIIDWQERGGPPVEPPSRRGFGTRLIERGLSTGLRGDVTLDFAPEGLRCTLTARLSAEGNQ